MTSMLTSSSRPLRLLRSKMRPSIKPNFTASCHKPTRPTWFLLRPSIRKIIIPENSWWHTCINWSYTVMLLMWVKLKHQCGNGKVTLTVLVSVLTYNFIYFIFIFLHQTFVRKLLFFFLSVFSKTFHQASQNAPGVYGSKFCSAFINMMSWSQGSRFKEVPSPKYQRTHQSSLSASPVSGFTASRKRREQKTS